MAQEGSPIATPPAHFDASPGLYLTTMQPLALAIVTQPKQFPKRRPSLAQASQKKFYWRPVASIFCKPLSVNSAETGSSLACFRSPVRSNTRMDRLDAGSFRETDCFLDFLGSWTEYRHSGRLAAECPCRGGGVKHVSRLGSSATPYWHPAHPTPFHALGRTIGVSWPMLLRELRTHCGAVLKLHAALFPDVAALLWPARVTPHLEAT